MRGGGGGGANMQAGMLKLKTSYCAALTGLQPSYAMQLCMRRTVLRDGGT